MDLPPYHHYSHHDSRYVNVPNFTPLPPFQQRHRPPLTPPPPRPPPPPPHHLLPPIQTHHISHNPLPPPSPAYFTLGHHHPGRPRSIEENSHRYELDRACSPSLPSPLDRPLPLGRLTDLPSHPPPPMSRETFHFQPIDNGQDRNPMFRDELLGDNIRNGFIRGYNNDKPDIWERDFRRHERNVNDFDFDRESIDPRHKQLGLRSERDFNVDTVRSHETYGVLDGDDRSWYNVYNNRGSFHLPNQESTYGDHPLARFRGRLGGGGRVEEFIRSPTKRQVQKKSALLRIQLGKSSNRNRGVNEYHHFSKEPTSSSYRGKEKGGFVMSLNKIEDERERGRERSPVNLDVSFKSNALVAKAIVSSPSPAHESVRNLTPRNRNVRKLNGMSGSPSVKLSATSARELDCQSDPNKALKGLEENVAVSGRVSTNNINADYVGDNAADKGSLGTMDSDQSGNSVGSDGTPINRIRKKRKLKSELVSESSQQLTKDSVGIVNANTCSNSQSALPLRREDATISEVNIPSADFDAVPDTVVAPCSDGGNISKTEESLNCVVSKEDGTDLLSTNHFTPNSKTKESSYTMFSASSPLADDVTSEFGHQEQLLVSKDSDHTLWMGIHEDVSSAEGMAICENAVRADTLGSNVHADNFDNILNYLPNTETTAIEFHNKFTTFGSQTAGGVGVQSLQDAVMSSNNCPVGGPPKVAVSVEDHDMLRPEENTIHEVQRDVCASKADNMFSTSETDNELFKGEEKVKSSSASFIAGAPTESISSQEVVPQDGVHCPLNTEDIKLTESAANADHLNLSSGTAVSTNFLSMDCVGNTAVSGIPHGHAIGRKSVDYGPTAFLGTVNSYKINSISEDVQIGLSYPKTTKVPVDVDSSIGREETRFQVDGIICAEEVDVPCDRDNSKDGSPSSEGPSEVEVSVQYGLDLVPNGLFSDYCKRKGISHLFSCCSLPEVFERPEGADTALPVAEVPSSSHKVTVQSESVIPCGSVFSSPCLSQTATLSNVSVREKSFPSGSIFSGDNRKPPRVPEKRVDKKVDITSVASETTQHQLNTRDMEVAISREIFDDLDMDKTVRDDDHKSENYLLVKDLAFVPNNSSLCADESDLYAISSSEELTASGCNMPSRVNSSENLLANQDLCLLESIQASPILRISPKKASSDEFKTNPLTSRSSHQKNSKEKRNTDLIRGASDLSKNQHVPKGFAGHPSSSFNTSKRAIPSMHFRKSKTWRRTDSSSVVVPRPKLQTRPFQQGHVNKTVGNIQSSYIRKGNSLVRKPSQSDISQGLHSSSSSVYRLSPSSVDNLNKQASQNKTDYSEAPSLFRAGVKTPERPETFSLAQTGEPFNCVALMSGKSRSSPVSNFPCLATTLDPLEEVRKSPAVPECQTGSGNNSDSQSTLDDGNSMKKITYVKRTSNQLVAVSDSENPPTRIADKTTQSSSSDGYYKRNTNQLIRASVENLGKEGALVDRNYNSHGHQSRRTMSGRGASKWQSYSLGSAKMRKTSKFSLVWKLRDTQLSGKDNNSVRCQKIRPYLFPWKRVTKWKNIMCNSSSTPNDSSLSTISRKLLISRKRGAIYTRSTRGFSLRISKVLSVGGSSLKWSKSIDRSSKKANEVQEATRAVAAAEKRKKEQTGAVPIVLKNKNLVSRKSVLSVMLRPGERIFRIGSERYKMDPTRKTLQRITADEEPSDSVPLESGKKLKTSCVPKRLLIGNEEYVRIGNGNQLIRDPKRRTRILASEKVRWSLHTARLRLTKKKKYCQFFTRFGKCSKEDGKCPYIHDPSKIVVCTKFLKGACLNPDCKLTHKIIPERMQDCSYFLQGSCSNENCPYRHVNVNPNASICESFLKGYCADGNECRNKHTYVCPAFESTGICPEGSKCKLHHPKRKRGIKRKTSSEQKNGRGRYFDSGSLNVAESPGPTERLHAQGNDSLVCQEDELGDFISLDFGDEEVEYSVGPSSKRVRCDGSPETQVVDLDERIKPIRLMNNSHSIRSSEGSHPVEVTAETQCERGVDSV